jgi:hypothetical protein
MAKDLNVMIFKKVFFFLFLLTTLLKAEEVALPTGVFKSPSEKAAVLVWFHGGMSSNRCDKGLIAGKDFFELTKKNVTVISPSACLNNHWVSPDAIPRIDNTLDSLERVFKKNIDTLFLAGVSDGALGVFTYSVLGKRVVKSRLLVSGFLKFLGEPSDFENYSKLKEGHWFFLQGAKDRLYPSSITFSWNRAFCEIPKIRCVLKEDSLGEHDWAYWQTNRSSWIFEFIQEIF